MSDEPEDQEARRKKIEAERVDDAVRQLGEHCDTVQIFVSRYNPETKSTSFYQRGDGCFYSRLGQAIEFVAVADERVRESIRGEKDDKEP